MYIYIYIHKYANICLYDYVSIYVYIGRYAMKHTNQPTNQPTTHTHIYIYIYIYIYNRLICVVGRVFANGSGDRGSIPSRVIPYIYQCVCVSQSTNVDVFISLYLNEFIYTYMCISVLDFINVNIYISVYM